jgi:NAD(P)-dependent dehydrogenase (short-subunit alcohol dehydrogenase family)
VLQARDRGDDGGRRRSIVNISSGVATKGATHMDAYTASKGAMNALTRSMAVGYAKQRIRVNAISTGLIDSGAAIADFLADPGEARVARAGDPPAVLRHARRHRMGLRVPGVDESRYVTGTVLPIDGGYLACPS